MKNKKFTKKSAITLAEILIVVAIVAVVTIIFVSIEGKNQNIQEKAKYYIAYTTLQKLLQEQVAESGKIALGNSTVNCGADEDCKETAKTIDISHTFKNRVDRWLNVASSESNTNATLTNGMILNWNDNDNDAEDDSNMVTVAKVVSIDIDGSEKGRGIAGQDLHYLMLSRGDDGGVRVKPIRLDNNDTLNYENNTIDPKDTFWISFKVYKVNAAGNTQIVLFGSDYQTAYNCYDSLPGNTCDTACQNDTCFIEPIPPIR